MADLNSTLVRGNLRVTSDAEISGKVYSGSTTIDGQGTTPLVLKNGKNNYAEGLRIMPTNSWSDIVLGGNDVNETEGISSNSWFLGNYNGDFYITRNGSSSGDKIISNTGSNWIMKDIATDTPLVIQGGSSATYLKFLNSSGNTLGFYAFDSSGNPCIYRNGNVGIILEGDSRLSNAREPYFANGTWYVVGDDSAIGDNNVAGTFCIKGLNGTPGINLYNSDGSYYASVITSANISSQSVNYATSSGNSDTVDNEHASAFAHNGTANNLIMAGNEFNFIPSSFTPDTVWFNYRTTSGYDATGITTYNLGDGKGGLVGTIIHSGNIGSQSVSYATSSGNADTLDNKHASEFTWAYYNHDVGADSFNDTTYIMTAGASGGSWSGTTYPAGAHNGMAILNVHTHHSNYYTQLCLSTNDNNAYIRSANGTSSFGSWTRLTRDGDNISTFNNDSGYITSSGSCAYAASAGNADTLDNHDSSYFAAASDIPATHVIPAETTANKILVSTTTSGTAAWSSFSSAGFLTTNASGVVSVDTTTYVPTTGVTDATGKAKLGVITSGFKPHQTGEGYLELSDSSVIQGTTTYYRDRIIYGSNTLVLPTSAGVFALVNDIKHLYKYWIVFNPGYGSEYFKFEYYSTTPGSYPTVAQLAEMLQGKVVYSVSAGSDLALGVGQVVQANTYVATIFYKQGDAVYHYEFTLQTSNMDIDDEGYNEV